MQNLFLFHTFWRFHFNILKSVWRFAVSFFFLGRLCFFGCLRSYTGLQNYTYRYNVGPFCKRDIVARRTEKKIITAATKENRTEEKDIWRLYANPNCRAVGYIRACENIVYNINQYTSVVRLPTSIYSIIDVVLLKKRARERFLFSVFIRLFVSLVCRFNFSFLLDKLAHTCYI